MARTNILIVGAGRGGSALIEMFSADTLVNILGVVDTNPEAPGMKLAKKLGIPTASDWKQFIHNKSLNQVVDVTGNEEVFKAILKEKPEAVDLMNTAASRMMWALSEEYNKEEKALKEAKSELEIQAWGLNKTNEAIKLLYKELEQKNFELQKLDQLKSEFISTVSHELRTPLSIIKEGVSLILDKIPGDVNEKQSKLLVTVKDNIDRLARIINNLLDISKIEAGRVELKRSSIDLTNLIRRVVTAFEFKAKEKGLQFFVSFPREGIEAYADSDKITQVFTNLIGNALKFTEHGSIGVSVQEKENEIECAVADTGLGISKEDAPKVFNKFQQFGRIAGSGEKGTGLGLSIVKGIVELHNGSIWFDSELGKGTKFYFTLPKYNTELALKEYLRGAITEAEKINSKVSLVMISVVDLEKVIKELSMQKLDSTLKNLEGLLANSLLREGDISLDVANKIFVILSECNKENALRAMGRLEQAMESYLAHEKLGDKLRLKFSLATYPDDAKSDEEWIDKINKS